MKEIKICQKALEKLFESKRSFVESKKEKGKTIYIFKGLKNDLDACYIDGNRVIWRVERASFVDGHGRWRNHKLDEIITFKINPIRIKIIEKHE